MIKLALLAILTLAATPATTAFVVVAPRPLASASASRLFLSTTSHQRPDASAAIDEAMRISKQFGASSPEAAVAWDAVEEISASDNLNNAFDIPSLDTECLLEEEISKACMDYGSKLDELSQLLGQTQPHLSTLKTVADEMAALKLKVSSNKPAPDSPELRQALANAKQVSKESGPTSPEAKIAWEAVEEIAAAGLGNSLGGSLDEECLVESAQDACKALEELHRALAKMQQAKTNAGQ